VQYVRADNACVCRLRAQRTTTNPCTYYVTVAVGHLTDTDRKSDLRYQLPVSSVAVEDRGIKAFVGIVDGVFRDGKKRGKKSTVMVEFAF